MATNKSEIVTASITFDDVYIHDPIDPEGTIQRYLYEAGAKGESLEAISEQLQFAGREFAVSEFGEQTTQGVELTVTVLFGEDHDEKVQALRDFVRNRRVVCLRDGRGRKVFGTISGISLTDIKYGTTVSFTLHRNDFNEAV